VQAASGPRTASNGFKRSRLLASLTGFFVTNLALFWIAGSRGLREGVVFYIWVGIFSVFMVSQFWAFANDIFTETQGKRLFPLIGAGMSLGALVGSAVVVPLVKGAGVGPYSLMLIAAAVLLIYLALMRAVAARVAGAAVAEKAAQDEAPLGIQGGFELILRDRYLFWIAVLIVLLNVVNTVGEYALGKLVVAEARYLPYRPREWCTVSGTPVAS
jgi:AAA family ATP:ADP antiporter